MKTIFVIVLALRLLLSLLSPFEIDMTGWRFWAARMVELGPAQFYSTKVFTDNPPGFLYVFWAIGAFKHYFLPNISYFGSAVFDFLLKVPSNLSDLLTGLLIYIILRRRLKEWQARAAFVLYTLNPVIFFNSSIFGQFDGPAALFMLLSLYFVVRLNKPGLASLSFALALAIKPQAIALAPVLGLLILTSTKPIKWVLSGLIFLGATLLIYWPFFPSNPVSGIFYVNDRMTKIFNCTTCFTFNFWGLFGNWRVDSAEVLGLPLVQWGIILLILSFIPIFFLRPFRLRFKEPYLYLTAALSILAFFTFLTRMHERYVFPFFAFFLIAVFLTRSKFLLGFFIFFSIFNTLNQYFPYAYYNTQLHLTPGLINWLFENFKLLSFIGFFSFIILLIYYLKILAKKKTFLFEEEVGGRTIKAVKMLPKEYREEKLPEKVRVVKYEKVLLVSLLLLTFLSRVIRLDSPNTYMFDEVYHAFTAVELEKGNKAAWEWWNTPPQGFAYEWTHPPLAKEMMIIGIKTLGPILPKQTPGVDGRIDPNPFAWRFPVALFGVGVVYLVYLLGKRLFSWRVGLISAFLVALDGLNFVQSRIGMNDTFFLFFMLASFYLFLKKRCPPASAFGASRWRAGWVMGVSLGLALASKWTAMYGIGILAVLYFGSWIMDHRSRKSLVHYLSSAVLYFVLIPIFVYLLSYVPFFTSGHTWKQFNELQHQMWWYHTRLKATHPYTSPWYSWPFMSRPVWYYVKYGGGNGGAGGDGNYIANIYAMGNPAIWWAGIVAIGYAVWKLLRSARKFFPVQNLTQEPLRGLRSSKILCLPAISILCSIIHNPLSIILLGYFGFFLLWAFSPRIMFIYHYLPSIPFMCLALGYGLDKLWENPKLKILATGYLILATLSFIYFYPHLSALPVSKWWAEQYFWFPSWR